MLYQVLSALEQFFLRWQRDGEARRGLPLCEWEADWRSPCELDEPREGRVAWRPHQRQQAADFAAMANALELVLHPAAQALFGHWFSRPILHLQGAAPTIASSIAAAPSPQRRLNLLHRNCSILTDSSDEAEAYSAPPKRLYIHCIAPSP